MAEVEVKDIAITTFPEKQKQQKKQKKKKKRRSSAGQFFLTFFLTLVACCGVAAVVMIFSAEQLDFSLPGKWLFGYHTTSYSEHPTDLYGLVRESEAVEDSYFDDAVFVGDSLTRGMLLYEERVGTHYGVVGIGISDALWREKYTLQSGYLGSAVDAATETNPGKIYLMFGTNGVNYTDNYQPLIDDYKIMIQHIRQRCPDALIYIQSIPPVTEGYSIAYPRLKPKKIQTYNNMLKEMAKAEACYYLDTNSVLSTESGHLPRMYTSDSGLHLNDSAYEVMFDYLKRHTVKK